ncbi:MAG: hypothetical protein JWP31_906 [Aeromicrobium sp.]|nr:hypothetical protein [Aeromicrobium sp.]
MGSLVLGFGAAASSAEEPVDQTASTTPAPSEPTPDPADTTEAPDTSGEPDTTRDLPRDGAGAAAAGPWGSAYPVTLETNFARPFRSISNAANSDFSLLNDLERLIRGTYKDPRTGKSRPSSTIRSNSVYMSISRMDHSTRVGRELIRAAKAGVRVRVIHGKASQSSRSRALQKALDSSSMRDADFKICAKGKSLACLSSLNGAIMHSKILLVSDTFTRDKKPAKGVIWSGSSNLGGPSAERTHNNGLTIYNDRKLWFETRQMWDDMYAERNIGNDYLRYIDAHQTQYGYSGAAADGYTRNYPSYGMFYSNLAHVTIYATPIQATPTNGKDPVLNLLKRVVPDDQCRIRLQENRFKYRRIAVAQKLVQLADQGCKVSIVAFQDDSKDNRDKHCQQVLRVCRPILDVLKTSSRRIEAAYAKPHDKTILLEAKLKRNALNPEEVAVDGTRYADWPYDGIRTKMVQAGSAALTGSNLVVSDEITTETTDASVYEDYLQHFKAILRSYEYRAYPY